MALFSLFAFRIRQKDAWHLASGMPVQVQEQQGSIKHAVPPLKTVGSADPLTDFNIH
jgi:hypothetical protein